MNQFIAIKDYTEVYVAVLFLVAGGFIFLATMGLKNLPDIYCRLHAACKATTIAKVFSFSAAAMYFWGSGKVELKIVLVLFFFFLTSAVGTHLIARAAYKRGNPKCPETWHDDYESKFTD